MVGRQHARDLVVASSEAARLGEVAEPDAAGHRCVVDVGDVVGVVDLVDQLEAPFLQRTSEILLAAHPERDRAGVPRVRAELRIAELLRQRAGFACGLGGAERRPDAASDQRPRAGTRLRLGELERAVDPAVDELAVGSPPPHAGPHRGLEGELRIELCRRRPVGRQLDRPGHRRQERIAVVPERVRLADRAPEAQLPRGSGLSSSARCSMASASSSSYLPIANSAARPSQVTAFARSRSSSASSSAQARSASSGRAASA